MTIRIRSQARRGRVATTKHTYERTPVPLPKALTGIDGFDEISGGGLPAGRTTLVVGGPGAGKTTFSLQFLVNGARFHGEPGILVAFEENAAQLRANAATFGWDLPALEKKLLFFLDARLPPSTARVGDFELTGMLTGLAAQARNMGAKRVVFDSTDALLYLLNDSVAERGELTRLREWLLDHGLTGIITAKTGASDRRSADRPNPLEFMADAVVVLNHQNPDGAARRSVRIAKYRGSAFADEDFPVVFGPAGMVIGDVGRGAADFQASVGRVSTGVARLDTMLDGGYLRGSSILVSGSPGTAKSTLAGAFVEAACKRGERTLYLAFDEVSSEIVRNLASVGLDLAPHVKSGRLLIQSAASESKSAGELMMALQDSIERHQPKAVVIDPISSLATASTQEAAVVAVRRLLRLTKSEGITAFCIAVLDRADMLSEATTTQITTVADTWIHLSYLVQGGERNRALTIVKARGTKHSNQVRELVLGSGGVTLTDVYTEGGSVLTGTARWEKEQEHKLLRDHQELELQARERRLALAEAEMALRQAEHDAEKALLKMERETGALGVTQLRSRLASRRGADRHREAKH